MSISKAIRLNNFWICSLLCTVLISTGTYIRNSGITSVSAHCTNAASKHFNFYRNFTRTYALVAEQALETHIRKGQDARFSLRLNEASPLFIDVSINRPDGAAIQLFFNESVNLSKYLPDNSSYINLPCAFAGQYDIFLSPKDNSRVKINVSLHASNSPQLLQYVQASHIRYENRFQKRQILFKWDKSKLDIHIMQYCLVINTQRNYDSLCEAASNIIGGSLKLFCTHLKAINNHFVRTSMDGIQYIDRELGSAFVCTGLKSKQLLQGFVPNKRYFVDLFGIYTKYNGLTFRLGSTALVFNRTTPIELHENLLEIGKLTGYDKKLAFAFKSQRNRHRTPTFVQFLVIPCNFAIKLSILNQKRLKTQLNIDHPMVIRVNLTRSNDRHVLKFCALTLDDALKNPTFKIIASTKERFQHFPSLPHNTNVEEIRALSTCTTSTITWHRSPDKRNIQYCVTVIKLKMKNFEDNNTHLTLCDSDKLESKRISPSPRHCILPSTQSGETERFQLNALIPGHNYAVQISLKLSNYSLPYRMLNIFKSHHCFISMMSQNQLPKVKNTSPKLFSYRHYEDNNVLVP